MRALVVEDELIVAMDLESVLNSISVEVVGIASNYNHAIKIFDKENPDIVFLDVNIKGGQTGVDVGNYIRRKNKDVCLVFISAFKAQSGKLKIEGLNALGFLEKPFKHAEVEEILGICGNKL